MRFTNKNGFSFMELLIAISFSWLIVSFAKPNIDHGSITPRHRDCISNIRNFTYALDMYNLDNVDMIENALPGRDFEDCQRILVEKKYLKDYLAYTDDECSYGLITITGSGTVVFCKKHGTLETAHNNNPFIPEYDKKLEKPFSSEYLNIVNQKKREREQKENWERLKKDFLNNILFNPIAVITTIIILFIIGFTCNIILYLKDKRKLARLIEKTSSKGFETETETEIEAKSDSEK